MPNNMTPHQTATLHLEVRAVLSRTGLLPKTSPEQVTLVRAVAACLLAMTQEEAPSMFGALAA